MELNNVGIFRTEAQERTLSQYIQQNPRFANTFRVPEGKTLAVAERLGAIWDLRDNPLGATRGTLVSASVEHVRATPRGKSAAEARCQQFDPDVFEAKNSQFLHFTSRLGGYVRLSEKGTALAASLQWGYNLQLLKWCRTYPDRLFFLGGVDSIRGFLQDSVVPQDIAEQLIDPDSGLSLNEVVIRGGDVFINPRLELRIPLAANVQTALFVDSGNLWADASKLGDDLGQLLRLRYAAGSALRVSTPIGPLVFDYGFNLGRVSDELGISRERRFWEDLGAFHFSIGLF